MFLFKLAFWLCVIITLAPIDTATTRNANAPTNVVAQNAPPSQGLSQQAVGLASATVTDMASFCDRNPAACATGTQVLDRFRVKAIAVAGYIFDKVAGARTGAIATSAPNRRAQPVGTQKSALPDAGQQSTGQNTLSADDLEAPWVGPVDGDA